MKQTASREALAKVILFGEHSVVYGQPAVAATVERRLRVTLVRNGRPAAMPDPRLRAALDRAAEGVGVDAGNVEVRIESTIPPGAGLGSSAALSVALVGALADLGGASLSSADLLARAGDVENVFHGTASGVDIAAVASRGVIRFERGDALPARLRMPSVDLVVIDGGERRSTEGPVGRLRIRVLAEPRLYEAIFAAAGEIARRGAEALGRGDWDAVGRLFDVAQGLLNALGVSTAGLERMIDRARSAGALGAKLTGAGGGGAVIALAPDNATEVAARLRSEGYSAFVTRIGTIDEENDDVQPSANSL
jgi:mevalonate kinase